MKLQLFSKMTAKPRGRKVVRASARAVRGDEDYYEAEPNMKLSHAFMVVLVLHVVAVGGIYAFNQLNASRFVPRSAERPAPAAMPSRTESAPLVAARQPGDADDPLPAVEAARPESAVPAFRTADIAPAPIMTATKSPGPVVETKPPAMKPAAREAASSSAETYTVAKGDNPYKIAKKLGIGYQALLDLNKIEDPTKLQIGTVLKVPAKNK